MLKLERFGADGAVDVVDVLGSSTTMTTTLLLLVGVVTFSATSLILVVALALRRRIRNQNHNRKSNGPEERGDFHWQFTNRKSNYPQNQFVFSQQPNSKRPEFQQTIQKRPEVTIESGNRKNTRKIRLMAIKSSLKTKPTFSSRFH